MSNPHKTSVGKTKPWRKWLGVIAMIMALAIAYLLLSTSTEVTAMNKSGNSEVVVCTISKKCMDYIVERHVKGMPVIAISTFRQYERMFTDIQWSTGTINYCMDGEGEWRVAEEYGYYCDSRLMPNESIYTPPESPAL